MKQLCFIRVIRVIGGNQRCLRVSCREAGGFNRKLHRQLQEHVLAESIDDQRHGVFLRNAALLQVEQLFFTDLRSRCLVLDA